MPPETQIPKLAEPEGLCEPSIPTPVRNAIKDPAQRWLYEQVSVINKQNEWLIQAALAGNEQLRAADNRVLAVKSDTEARLVKLETFNTELKVKAAIVVTVLLLVLAPLIKNLVDGWVKPAVAPKQTSVGEVQQAPHKPTVVSN